MRGGGGGGDVRVRRLAVTATVLAALATPMAALDWGPASGVTASGVTASGVTHRVMGYANDARDREYDSAVVLTLYRVTPDGGLTVVGRTHDGAWAGVGWAFEVPDGTYLLHAAVPEVIVWEAEWYGNAAGPETSTPIVVAGADVLLDDIILERRRVITGRVTDPGGRPLVGKRVMAHRVGDVPATPPQQSSAMTDADGRFRIPSGRGAWRLEVTDPTPRAYADEWFEDEYSFETAATVTVQDDTEIGDIVISRGASVSGTVTSATGAPVPGVRVGRATHSGSVFSGTVTGPDGTYRIPALGPGTRVVTFNGGRAFLSTTRTVTLTADQQLAGLDVTLTPSAPEPSSGTDVTGRILDSDGRPVPDVRLKVITSEPDEVGEPYGGVYGTTDASGVFRLKEVDPAYGHPVGSTYRLYMYQLNADEEQEDFLNFVFADDNAFEVQSTWYGGGLSWAQATPLVVSPDLVDLGDITLPRAGGVSGTVLTEQGVGLPSGEALAVRTTGEVIGRGLVRADGSYRIRGLAEGDYRIRFSGRTDEGSTAWSPASSTPSGAVPVHVSAGRMTTGIDYRFRDYARPVRGRLVDPQGDPVTYHRIRFDSTNPSGHYEDASTDDEGRFDVAMPPDTYRVQVADSVRDEAYRDKILPSVVVTAAADVVDLGDIRLSPFPTVSGRVTGIGNAPLWDVQVYANVLAPPEGILDQDATRPDGTYRLIVRIPGRTRIEFDDRNLGYEYEYWPDAEQSAGAVPIDVQGETQLTGLDQRMRLGTAPPPPPTPPPPTQPPPTRPPSSDSGIPLETRTSATARVVRPTRGSRAEVVLYVAVDVNAQPPPELGGVVEVYEHGALVARRPVRSRGPTRVVLRGVRVRRHTYTVIFLGGPTTRPSSDTVVVRVKRRPGVS